MNWLFIHNKVEQGTSNEITIESTKTWIEVNGENYQGTVDVLSIFTQLDVCNKIDPLFAQI